MTENQPATNDYRTRIARPIFAQTFCSTGWGAAEHDANRFSEQVSDAGGEVIGIAAYSERDCIGDYPAQMHYRVVTYRAPRQIPFTYPTFDDDDDVDDE